MRRGYSSHALPTNGVETITIAAVDDMPAELRRIRFHDLRHTQATLWLKSGEPTYIVSRRLGHVSDAFTQKQYAHVLPGQQRDAALRFAELIGHDSSPSVRHQNHA